MYKYIYIDIYTEIYVRMCVAANVLSKPLLLPSSTFPIKAANGPSH